MDSHTLLNSSWNVDVNTWAVKNCRNWTFEKEKTWQNQITGLTGQYSLEEFPIVWYFTFVVYPIIGIIGPVGNILSFIVLLKSGHNNTSNILLLCLTIADTVCLTNTIMVPEMLSLIGNNDFWEYSYYTAYALHVVRLLTSTLNMFGSRVSSFLTVLITVERLIAIFFPRRFSSIVTPTRVWIISVAAALLWLPWCIFLGFTSKFHYYDGIGGIYGPSELYLENTEIIQFVLNNIINHLGRTIPFVLVTSGCVVIFIKIKTANRKRQKMMSGTKQTKASSSRTTRTLLAVCLVFSLTNSTYLLSYVLGYNIYYLYLRNSLMYINHASNFFIYVALNNKFRNVLKSILCLYPAKQIEGLKT